MPTSAYDAHETRRMHELHGAPLAPFGRRAAALLIDLAFGVALFLILSVIVILLVKGSAGQWHFNVSSAGGHEQAAPGTFQLKFFSNWYSVVWWVLYFGLTTYFGKGQTPGKRLLHIRVVSLVHDRLSLWHAVERALGYGASALEFGFGFAQYFIHRNHRTVHDRIAETIVVDVPRRAPAPSA